MKESKSIIQALNKAEDILRHNEIQTPRLDAEVLLAYLLKKDRAYLYINKDKTISYEVLSLYYSQIQMRAKGKPVAYIIGSKEFFSLDFVITPDVLIPRPETELLVEKVIEAGKQILQNSPEDNYIRIIEIGTGSGIIPVSIAKHIEKCIIYSVDTEQGALDTALQNSKKHSVSERIILLKGDMFKPFMNNDYRLINNTDIVVSNPPYIPSEEISHLQRDVKEFEPITALDGGRDGLFFYREIIQKTPIFLKQGGLVALEIGYNQASALKKLINDKGLYTEPKLYKDLAGLDRIITTTLK